MHKADMKLSRYMRMAEPDLTIAVELQTGKKQLLISRTMLSLSFVEDQDSVKPSHSRTGADCYGRIRASREWTTAKIRR